MGNTHSRQLLRKLRLSEAYPCQSLQLPLRFLLAPVFPTWSRSISIGCPDRFLPRAHARVARLGGAIGPRAKLIARRGYRYGPRSLDRGSLEGRDRYNQNTNLLLIRCRLHKCRFSMQLLIADYLPRRARWNERGAGSLAPASAVVYLSRGLPGPCSRRFLSRSHDEDQLCRG